MDYTCISARDIIDEMDNLPDNSLEESQELTDKLIKNAEKVHMSREDVLQSVKFYTAVKNVMNKHESNGFAIPCFEICAKRIMEERKVIFCLTHTLLKDEGFPSACEGDISALMAMVLLMQLSRKSAYMGNSCAVEKETNTLIVNHDVPGLKMKGIDEPALPYEIRNFTVGGWGVTVRYDFSRDVGSPVTLARFNPLGTKLLVVKGEIAGCSGFSDIGCSLCVHIRIKGIEDLFQKEMDFGHHLALVYGDYVEEIRELSKLMGFEVVET